MTKAFAIILLVLPLAACGVDGAPTKPTYKAQQTIGYNSRTGAFNKTLFGICFGSTTDCQ